MEKTLKVLFVILVSLFFGACATWRGTEGKYKSSELSNPHPASPALTPPDLVDGENATLDPTYVRSKADYHFALAESYSLDGRAEKAVEEFKLCLLYDTSSTLVRLRLAAEYVKLGLMSEGIEQAEIAAQNDAGSVEARLLLGGLYASAKMFDRATKYYEEAMILDANNFEIPLYVASVLAEQKKFDEAENYLSELAERKGNANAHMTFYYIGRIRLEQGGEENVGKAEAAFIRSIGLKPDFVDAVVALFQIYASNNQKAKGVKMLHSFQLKFGPNAKIARELSQHYLDEEKYDAAAKQLEILESFDPENLNVKLKLALILIEQKKFEKAADKLEEIIAMEPGSDKIRFYLGAVYEEMKQPKSAIEHFSRVGPESAYYAESVVHVAHLYKTMKNPERAEKTIIAAIAKRDDVAQFYAFYASLLDDRKEYKRAHEMLMSAVQKFPEHLQLRFFLGSMHDRLGQPEKCIDEMKIIIAADPTHVQALNYLAYTYAELDRNLNEAEDLVKKALKADPKDPYILDTMGWVLYKQGRLQESIKFLEAAHKSKEDEAIVAEHLGDAYYRFQLIEKAKEMYIKAANHEQDQIKREQIRSKIFSIEQELSNKRTPASVGP